MSVLIGNPLLLEEKAADDSYEIKKSIRFNRDDSPFVVRDLASNGDRSRFTISVWYKFNGDQQSLSTSPESYLWSGDTSYLVIYGNGYLAWDIGNSDRLVSNDKFMDPGKWYHCVAVADTTAIAADERLRLYVNGERLYSFSTNNTASLAYQSTTIGVQGSYSSIGALGGGRQMDGFMSDVRFFDGVALDPADLGKFHVNDVWHPKEPKLNPINDGTTWSGTVTGSINGTYPATQLFDGKESTSCRAANGQTITWKPASDIEAGSDIRIRVKFVGSPYGNDVVLNVNGISILGGAFDDHIGDGNTGWYPLRRMFRGADLRKITSADGIQWSTSSDGTKYAELLGIEVDGKVLIDGSYDTPELNNPNDGRVWSSQLTESTSNGFNNEPFYSFDAGVGAASVSGSTDGDDYTEWAPNPGVAYTKKVELWVAGFPNGDYSLNGGSWTAIGDSESEGFQAIATGSGTITNLKFRRVARDGYDAGNTSFRSMVRIDGYVLIDRHFPHDCHIDFQDTADNKRIGWGKDDGTSGVAAYTDGSQIQWGEDANKSNLVLCLPGYDNADKHHLIKGSGSAKTLTVDDTIVNTTTDQNGGLGLYGSFIKFNGSASKIVAAGGADYDFGTGNFTLEAWIWRNSNNTLTIMSSHNYNTAGTDGNWRFSYDYANGTLDFKCYDGTSSAESVSGNMPGVSNAGWVWTHVAVVRRGTGSNQTSLYVNGEEIATGTITKDLSAGANNINIGATVTASGSSDYFAGNMNDVRIYKGAAKYATGSYFKRPWRYDFGTRNIDLVSGDLDVKRTGWQNVVLYTGTGENTTQDIDVGFKPGIIILKNRGDGYPVIIDENNGFTKKFNIGSDNQQNTETWATQLTNGFQATGNGNKDGVDYVAYCWRVGDGATPVSNTDGDITTTICTGVEPRVGAGSKIGIIKYTGNGQTDQTIGHGCGNSPYLIIGKSASSSTSFYLNFAGGAHYYRINSTDGRKTTNVPWSSFGSSTFTVTGLMNTNNENYTIWFWCHDSQTFGMHADASYGGGNGIQGVGGPPLITFFKGLDWDGGDWIWYDTFRDTAQPVTIVTKMNSDGGEINNSAYEATYPYNTNQIKFAAGISDSVYKNNSIQRRFTWHGDDPSWETGAYGYDTFVDTPTNKVPKLGDSGIGGEVLGSYPTINRWNTPTGANLVVTAGGLQAKNDFVHGTDENANLTFTHAINSGKWYWEAEITNFGGSGTGSHVRVGIVQAGLEYGDDGDGTLGGFQNSFAFIADNRKIVNGSPGSLGHDGTLSDHVPVGEKILIAFDADNKKLYFGRKGQWLRAGNNSGAVADPANGNNPHYVGGTGSSDIQDGPWVPAISLQAGNWLAINFGQRAFTHTAPTGFKCLCTANYPDVLSITADGTDWVNNGRKAAYVNKYSGTGVGNRDIYTGFKPGLVWTKVRDDASVSHCLVDIIRGGTKVLDTVGTAAEATVAQSVTQFNNDGYRIGTDNLVNSSSYEYMSWAWNAGEVSSSANTEGTITVAAGDQAASNETGFSVTKYTGNNTNGATVGHGLDAAPAFYVVKRYDGAGEDWMVYHKGIGATHKIRLNTDNGSDADNIWYDTAPTASKIYLKNDNNVNGSTMAYMLYAWKPVPGFSQFGTYKGHGWKSFITCDFSPQFVIIKRSDGTGDWVIYSEMRDEHYYSSRATFLNKVGVEQDDHANNHLVEFYSNGFRPGGGTLISQDGQNYIYAAFGEWPFKVARGR